jgi:hypothetical protein
MFYNFDCVKSCGLCKNIVSDIPFQNKFMLMYISAASIMGPTKECPGMPGNAREHSLNARECPGEITLIITLVTNKIAYFMKD